MVADLVPGEACLLVHRWLSSGYVLTRQNGWGELVSLATCVETLQRDFPRGPVVKTSPSSVGGVGLIPGWGAKIPHASWPKKQKLKQATL